MSASIKVDIIIKVSVGSNNGGGAITIENQTIIPENVNGDIVQERISGLASATAKKAGAAANA